MYKGARHLSRELSASGCLSVEQLGGFFLSVSFSERLEGKSSMYSYKPRLDGGASNTLWGKKNTSSLWHNNISALSRWFERNIAWTGSMNTSSKTVSYFGLDVIVGDGHGKEVRGR